jgi:hypothetical protein
MKTFKFIFVFLAILAFVIPSCKKGDNDPWLSFRSRKNRLCGKWALKSGTSSYIYNDTTESINYTGSNAEITYSTAAGTFNSGTVPYTEKWTINKDETFIMIKNNYNYYLTIEGIWSFGEKSEQLDLKNKESVIFYITSKKYVYNGSVSGNPDGTYFYTYKGSYCPTYNYTIDQLKNKEIIVKYEGASAYTDFSENGTGTFTFKPDE